VLLKNALYIFKLLIVLYLKNYIGELISLTGLNFCGAMKWKTYKILSFFKSR